MKMKITSVRLFDEKELVERLKNLTMLENDRLYPYRDAYISVEKICVEELHPPQRYVLKSELAKVRELKWRLEEHGVDMFDLKGFVRLSLEGSSEPVDLLPPVVEEIVEKNGRITHIVNDGMHRIYAAYLEWVVPRVVYVRGLPRNAPYYAFAIPERDWTKIELRDDIPPTYIKKWHRIERNKTLYRNFNSVFSNVGGPRGNPSKKV
jgi:hypothetical protein